MWWNNKKRKVVMKYIKHCYHEMYEAYVIQKLAMMALATFAILGLLIYVGDLWGLLMLEAGCLIFGYFCWRSLRFYWQLFVFLHATHAEGKTMTKPQQYRHGSQPLIVDILMLVGAVDFVLSCDIFCRHWYEKFGSTMVMVDIAIVIGVIIVVGDAGILLHDYFEGFPDASLEPRERL